MMKARLAQKIRHQASPNECSPRCRAYWERYHKAEVYTDRLFRTRFKKLRKEGRKFPTDDEIDELIEMILSE